MIRFGGSPKNELKSAKISGYRLSAHSSQLAHSWLTAAPLVDCMGASFFEFGLARNSVHSQDARALLS